jgi:hypothetical protein
MREQQYLRRRRENVFVDGFQKDGLVVIHLGVHAIAVDRKIRG